MTPPCTTGVVDASAATVVPGLIAKAFFDRLTGEQLVTYSGLLRGLDRQTVAERTADLLRVMDLSQDADKLVVDYSAGMTKKVALASAMIHAPKVLVLDEPFEAVDPVSAANIRDILAQFVASGGTVVVSSHVMDLVQRMCDHVAIVAAGRLLVAGGPRRLARVEAHDPCQFGERIVVLEVNLVGGVGMVSVCHSLSRTRRDFGRHGRRARLALPAQCGQKVTGKSRKT